MARVTLDFLQKIISATHPDVTVTGFQDTPGSGRGDNYTAMLYRIKLQGYRVNREQNTREHWEESMIYKCIPDNYVRREAFKSDSLFRNEVAFYINVMPVLLNYQCHQDGFEEISDRKSKGLKVKKAFRALPHCYFAKSDVLVLEDMCTRGFKMGDRKLGLNYDQCLAVVKELAKFHALSLAFKVEKPAELRDLLNNKNCTRESYFIKENEEWYRSYYTAVRHNSLAMVQECLSHNKNGEKYVERFGEFVDDSFYFRMMSLVKPTEPLAVFCHGDCWTNNILFSVVDSKINDVCLVDFQLCRYASPALDLANLLYCCTTRQLRDAKLENLLLEYFETLYNFLEDLLDEETRLRCQFIQKEELKAAMEKEFRRCSLFGLGLALDMIPISTCDSDQAPDLYDQGNVHKDQENLEQIEVCPVWTSNESCKKKMVNLVCELVDKRIL